MTNIVSRVPVAAANVEYAPTTSELVPSSTVHAITLPDAGGSSVSVPGGTGTRAGIGGDVAGAACTTSGCSQPVNEAAEAAATARSTVRRVMSAIGVPLCEPKRLTQACTVF
ncbi:hypothetical protein GCM10009747_31860 [Agromyces humatus]|uniref:Uncharacterized protein n=1 Tax=Agromyces humatus TaxID=279573 RepID=A0ABN2KYE5_9MICO